MKIDDVMDTILGQIKANVLDGHKDSIDDAVKLSAIYATLVSTLPCPACDVEDFPEHIEGDGGLSH